jgi:hypothetical protein
MQLRIVELPKLAVVLEDFALPARQHIAGEIDQRTRSLNGTRILGYQPRHAQKDAAQFQQQHGIALGRHRFLRSAAGCLAHAGATLHQFLQSLFCRQRGAHGGQRFRHQHIPIARGAERTGQPAQLVELAGEHLARESVTEYAERAAQATYGDPCLMHILDVIRVHHAALVGLQVFDAAEYDRPQGIATLIDSLS